MKNSFVAAVIIVATVCSAFADQHPPRAVEPEGAGPHLQVIGDAETVFDWSEDSCDLEHHADLPVRAYVDNVGIVHLLMGNITSRRMSGVDFDSLKVNCDPVMRSMNNPAPQAFAHQEWIAAVYTEDGETVHALVHNEYQGNRLTASDCPSRYYFKCWYNTITYTRSVNGGAQFDRSLASPDHLVASLPIKYMPDAGIFGAFSPSNIIYYDGYHYAFFKVQTWPTGAQHSCLMRTNNVADPSQWRFWTLFGFDGEFADPYLDDEKTLALGNCDAVDPADIAQLHENITWNSRLKKFVLVGTSSDPARDPNIFGFYYALSDDLVNWERRKPLLEVRLPWRTDNPNIPVYLYPALIDHDSTSRNFETTDESMFLYFTRLNDGQSGFDRDLMRIRVGVAE